MVLFFSLPLDVVLQGACPVPAAEDAGAPMKQREAPAAPPLTANDVTDLATFNKRLQRVGPGVCLGHPSLPLSVCVCVCVSPCPLSLSLSVCVCVCVCVFVLPTAHSFPLSLPLCPSLCRHFLVMPGTWADFLFMIDSKLIFRASHAIKTCSVHSPCTNSRYVGLRHASMPRVRAEQERHRCIGPCFQSILETLVQGTCMRY
jgi:hypothetical protein